MKILITGATSKLGIALAHVYRDAHLILLGRNEQRLKTLQKEFSTAKIFALDLCNQNELKQAMQLIHKEIPDLIIQNAGIGYYGEISMHSFVEEQETILLNCLAIQQLTMQAIQTFKQHHLPGIILHVSSASAFFPYPTFCSYAATKRFITHFSQSLDLEVRPYGIRVLCSCPGPIQTDFQINASKAYFKKVEGKGLTPIFVAKKIQKQIQKGQQLNIIDWKIFFGVLVSKLFPKQWVAYFLKKAIKERIPKT